MTICIFVLKNDLCDERAYKRVDRNTIENLQSIRLQLESENDRLKKDIKDIRQVVFRG